MKFDSSLDETLFSKELESDGVKIVVSVHSYNNGAKKLQLVRETRDAEGNWRFGKLGRLTKAEVEGILPLINESLGHM
ncbi:MAG: hypothetical protein PHS64_03410 [Candidatus Omnitrophica bacterium]|nr:hypothetical protein [Candidatus Omnitrophota bacterium]MDD5774973.1 hypothetical protein [Candidatus Omnitrophota bacterium]HNQ51058.1 hypothetical protein [Candidatus Omnitrophota bacterium]HQO37918.1 hypothetical protein [Candidatus Omnitrophota bacterium]HQQ06682.1 hypothetical protein [Candidatus Omnitrophota bacterium]